MDNGRVSSKDKIWFLVIGIILVLGFIFGVVMMINDNNQAPDSETTSAEVLALMEDSYSSVADMQDGLRRGLQGSFTVNGAFSEATKNDIDMILTTLSNFGNALGEHDPTQIMNDVVKENYIALQEAVNNDMPAYDVLGELYSLFYDYVNNDYSSSYAKKIIELDDDRITEILEVLNEALEKTGEPITVMSSSKTVANDIWDYYDELSVAILTDIFNVALGEDYPALYYYEPMGYIIGELSDEE